MVKRRQTDRRSAPGRRRVPRPKPGPRETALAYEPGRLQRLLRVLGPGLISGASDDDPATIGTCASVGASVGFAALWTMLFVLPLMMAVQFISAKIGQVSGRGLAAVLRKHYPRWLLCPVVAGLLVANTINAGADLGAIAAAGHLLVPAVPAGWLVVPVALLILALQGWGTYRLIERVFKWLVLSLLAYIGAGILARPDWGMVLWHTFVPTVHLDRDFLEAMVALLGTTFAPYLYFWQSDEEVEQKRAIGRRRLWQRQGTTDAELKYAAWDVNLGMAASNTVTYFILLATAATLFRAGQHKVRSAAEAAEALRPLAGPAAEALLAVGLIGAGLLAVPVLTSAAAFALAEALGWEGSLDQKPWQAKRFYAIIAASTTAAVALDYAGINPIRALVLTSTIYGFLAPPLLIVLLLVSNNRAVVGDRVNGRALNGLGWVAVAATSAATVGLVLTWFLP